jgi:hypothetical protein
MIEYKMTKQGVDGDWSVVEAAPTREMDLYPPAGDDWTLHSFKHHASEVVAVWSREKRHGMSDVYVHSGGVQTPAKTIEEMPEPKGTT